MTDLKIRSRVIVLAAILSVAGCSSPAAPTTPLSTAPITLFYSSRLLVGGSAWRSFQLGVPGTVTVQLTSLNPDNTVVVGLGIGQFSGTTCTLTSGLATTPGTDPQISQALTPGAYCVKIWDLGNLTVASDFSINIVVPIVGP
jgi:hypothetical protein